MVVLLCMALLALLTVIQVAHVHSINTDADHCPLCIALHTAAPVATATAAVELIHIEGVAAVNAIRPVATTIPGRCVDPKRYWDRYQAFRAGNRITTMPPLH